MIDEPLQIDTECEEDRTDEKTIQLYYVFRKFICIGTNFH